MIRKLIDGGSVGETAEAQGACIACWLEEWFECDDVVGSALSSMSIMGHGRQPLNVHTETRSMFRALEARRAHYMKMPRPECSCDADPVADLHAACNKLNDAPQREVDEACDDMAEFIATMKPKWYVLKDDDQLKEAAREAGLIRAIGD